MATKKVKKAAPKLHGIRIKTLAELLATGWKLEGNSLKHPTKSGSEGLHRIDDSDLIGELGTVVSPSTSYARDPALVAERVFIASEVRFDELGVCKVLTDGSIEMGCGDRVSREDVKKVYDKLQKIFGTVKAKTVTKVEVPKAKKTKK